MWLDADIAPQLEQRRVGYCVGERAMVWAVRDASSVMNLQCQADQNMCKHPEAVKNPEKAGLQDPCTSNRQLRNLHERSGVHSHTSLCYDSSVAHLKNKSRNTTYGQSHIQAGSDI